MGVLTETGLDDLLRTGCPACGAGQLTFRAYLDARLPLLGGEPVGKLTWVYDGEKFVDGVFEVACTGCQHVVLAASLCPRCHEPDSLARVLSTENDYPLLKECPSCQGEELRYLAMLPAWVAHDGRRAERARTHTSHDDAGFHGYRVDCADCGTVAEKLGHCPLCGHQGPLRPRPG